MSFRISGIEFSVSVPFALLITFLLVNDRSGMMTASLFAMAVHEAGHLVTMKLIKCAPRTVKLQLGGILICADGFCTFSENVLVALSGPAANILTFLVLLPVYHLSNSVTVLKLAGVQLLIAVLNLFPVKGLDGGTIVISVLQKVFKKNEVLTATVISVIFSFLLFTAGIAVLVRNTDNPSLLLLSIYLIILNILKR